MLIISLDMIEEKQESMLGFVNPEPRRFTEPRGGEQRQMK